MHCQTCSALNPASNRFCESCGGALSQVCAACGYASGPAARFCGGCGAPIERATPHQAAPPPLAAWGELKLATILFADIVSSTEHISGMDPEQAMSHLRPAVATMCGAIESFGGTVIRTLGDGVMAVFGVPRALEGHASLACEAALGMQRAFRDHEGGLAIRVGLHSGQVASDPQSTDATIGGGVHGQAIHLASRVVALAEPGGVCITSACLALVRQACDVRSMGAHTLKGIGEPIEVHALLRMKDGLDGVRLHQAAASTFRGRKRELATLQDSLRRAETGLGAAIGLSAAPGTGKSRLCQEFASWCRGRGVPVYEVRTQLYGHATPLQPVLTLLRTCFFQIAATDDVAAAKGRIARQLLGTGVATHDDCALFNEFLGIAEPEDPPCSLQPKARRVRLLNLVRELVKHGGTDAFVIIFEDLHWLDEASEEFVSVLVDAVERARILLVLNYRPEYQAPWLSLPHFHQMNLPQLSAEETEALVQELLSTRVELKDAFGLIVERSAGNPFFAEELVHALLESEVLAGVDSGASPSLDLIARALPPTVQAVIGERIDRLVLSQKTLLHICAVIGKEIPLPVLEKVAVYLADQLESELNGLCEAELLQLLREITGGRHFAFRHPLIQEVAYGTQLKARRANLHAAVAVAMETHYRARPDEFAALIAYHYEAAGQVVHAAHHEAKAAQWLGATNSTQAMRHWRKARALLLDQPRSAEIDRLRVRIGSGFVYLGWREGLSADEVQQIVEETVELATDVDSRLIQLLYLAEGRILQGNGGPADDYVRNIEKAIAIAPSLGDSGRAASMNAALSHAYSWAGRLEEGLVANDVALKGVMAVDRLDREFFGFDLKQWILGIRVRLLIRMARFDEAATCLRSLADSIIPAHDPVIRQVAHCLRLELALGVGDVPLAREQADNISAIAQISQNAYTRTVSLWASGLATSAAGDFDQAASKFLEALDLIRSSRVAVEFEAEILAGLAECRDRAGAYPQAILDARSAVTTSRQRSHRIAECRALIVWARALVRCHGAQKLDEARELLDQAQALVSLTGARLLEPQLAGERAQLNQLAAD
ncbi:MAG: AAA family ATPase [Ramlibacter sp.]|nr:AAA family ATPase [Ramlibacter sp.]